MGKHVGKMPAMFGSFLWNRCSSNRFKSYGESFCFDLVKANPDFMAGEPKTPHCHDLLIFEPVISSQNQLILFLETTISRFQQKGTHVGPKVAEKNMKGLLGQLGQRGSLWKSRIRLNTSLALQIVRI